MSSSETVVIYFASVANQSLAVTAFYFCLFTQRENGSMGRKTNSQGAQTVLVPSQKAPPHKGVKEALRDNTKNCRTGLTCRYNNTQS